jgi:hypothetical protein
MPLQSRLHVTFMKPRLEAIHDSEFSQPLIVLTSCVLGKRSIRNRDSVTELIGKIRAISLHHLNPEPGTAQHNVAALAHSDAIPAQNIRAEGNKRHNRIAGLEWEIIGMMSNRGHDIGTDTVPPVQSQPDCKPIGRNRVLTSL